MNNNKKVVTFDDLVKRYKKMYMEVKKQNNMKTFKDLYFITNEWIDGVQSRIMFDNGYGISVIRSKFSYGGKMDLYEIGILDSEGDICYTTPITDSGVIGYLRKEDVSEVMIRIQNLPTIENTNTDNTTNTK